jgi:hypothetical protein
MEFPGVPQSVFPCNDVNGKENAARSSSHKHLESEACVVSKVVKEEETRIMEPRSTYIKVEIHVSH